MSTRAAGESQEPLSRALQEQGVKYCLASYVDLHGIPKCKAVPIAHLPRMLNCSEMFTGAQLLPDSGWPWAAKCLSVAITCLPSRKVPSP